MLDRIEHRLAQSLRAQPHWAAFSKRLSVHGPRLVRELSHLYGERPDFEQVVEDLLHVAYDGWRERPADLQRRDAEREQAPDWFASNQMLEPTSRARYRPRGNCESRRGLQLSFTLGHFTRHAHYQRPDCSVHRCIAARLG